MAKIFLVLFLTLLSVPLSKCKNDVDELSMAENGLLKVSQKPSTQASPTLDSPGPLSSPDILPNLQQLSSNLQPSSGPLFSTISSPGSESPTEPTPPTTSSPGSDSTTEPTPPTSSSPGSDSATEPTPPTSSSPGSDSTTEPTPPTSSSPGSDSTTEPTPPTSSSPGSDSTTEPNPSTTSSPGADSTTEPNPSTTSSPGADSTTEPTPPTTSSPGSDSATESNPPTTLDAQLSTDLESSPAPLATPDIFPNPFSSNSQPSSGPLFSTITSPGSESATDCVPLIVTVHTDAFPLEMAWSVPFTSPSVGHVFGDYQNHNAEYVESICLPAGQHALRVYDGFGDGWSHNGLVGNLSVRHGDQTLLFVNGNTFTLRASLTFTVSISSPSIPNPRPSTSPQCLDGSCLRSSNSPEPSP